MIESDSLTFSYPGSSPMHFEPFRLQSGESLLILGPSGSGKSTWLQLLSGLRQAHSGAVRVNGKNLNELNPSQRDRFRARHIGLIFQQSFFIPSLNALDNLRVAYNRPSFPEK